MVMNPDLTDGASQGLGGPVVTDLVTVPGRRQAGLGRAAGAVRPPIWSICRRHGLGTPTQRTAARTSGSSSWTCRKRSGSRPRCPAGCPPRPAGNAAASCACRRNHATPARRRAPRPSRMMTPGQRGRTARGRAPRGPARGFRGPAALLPAADRPAHRQPSPDLCRHQRQAGPPGRQHRPEPRPLPGQIVPPGHRRADQPRWDRGEIHGQVATQ